MLRPLRMPPIAIFLIVVSVLFGLLRGQVWAQPQNQVVIASRSQTSLLAKIDRLLKIFADPTAFPTPSPSPTLRITAPALIEKAESLHFAALDYQFLACRLLKLAKQHLAVGDSAKAEESVGNAHRCYQVATALRRDSQAVLDGTYSAVETATDGVKTVSYTHLTLPTN